MHYHTAYTVGVKTKWDSRPQSSACMVSTAPPLPLPSVVSPSFLCFYSMAHKSSEAQNTTGRVILIAYTTQAYFLSFDFFFPGTRESDSVEPSPPLDKKRRDNKQQEMLECRMTPPSGCCGFQTQGWMHLGVPLRARARGWCELGTWAGGVASV